MMAFFSSAWAKIAALVAALGLVALVVVRIFLAGKAAARVEQMETTLKNVGKAKRVEDSVRAKPDAELDEQLRKQREQLK